VRPPYPTLGPARQAGAASDRALEDLRLQQRRVNAQLAARGPDLWHAAPGAAARPGACLGLLAAGHAQ